MAQTMHTEHVEIDAKNGHLSNTSTVLTLPLSQQSLMSHESHAAGTDPPNLEACPGGRCLGRAWAHTSQLSSAFRIPRIVEHRTLQEVCLAAAFDARTALPHVLTRCRNI